MAVSGPVNVHAGGMSVEEERDRRSNHLLGEAHSAPMATTSYLDRLLEPLTKAFTPKMASVLLELRADSEVEAHIGELR